MTNDLPILTLSIAAPAFNEEEGIRRIVQEWYDYLKNKPDIKQFEILICNDGSEDATGSILDDLAKQHTEIRPIHLLRNQGAAAALATAIQHTQLDWILLIDSDNQFPIQNLSIMISELHKMQAQAVLGTRNKKDSFFARFGSAASGLVCNMVYGTKIKDFNSAFKLVSGPLLRSFKLEAKGMNYSTEITAQLIEAKVILVEAPIVHQVRSAGKSSMKLVRDSLHRLLFVSYISLRQLLIKLGTLRRPS